MPKAAKVSSIYATGRRKRAIARVWVFEGANGISVNGRNLDEYLQRTNLKVMVEEPLKTANLYDRVRVQAFVQGGGLAGQAGALRLGIARALLKSEEKFQKPFRRRGFLTRDPRKKERKKFGHKGARKSFQYTKR